MTKSTFGLGTTVCNILWGQTLLIASAKSFTLKGFKSQIFSRSNLFFGEPTNGLLFFSLWPKYFRLKHKSLMTVWLNGWVLVYMQSLKSFIFFWFNSFWIWQPLIGIACTCKIGQPDSNCSFNTIHCSWNLTTFFSYTSHAHAMTGLYFCSFFKYYPKFVEWILYWLRFSAFSSDDTVFTSWKIMVLQMLNPSWFIVALLFL